jgi:hypothetical protein
MTNGSGKSHKQPPPMVQQDNALPFFDAFFSFCSICLCPICVIPESVKTKSSRVNATSYVVSACFGAPWRRMRQHARGLTRPHSHKTSVSWRKPLIFPETGISPLSCSEKLSVFKPPSSRLRSKFFGRTATSQSGQPLKELARCRCLLQRRHRMAARFWRNLRRSHPPRSVSPKRAKLNTRIPVGVSVRR